MGDGVNIASRIEPLANPDGICITEVVHQSIKSKLKIDAKRVTEVDLKNIDDKYTLYKLPKLESDLFKENNNIEINVDKNVLISKIVDKTEHFKEFLISFLVFSRVAFLTLLLIFTLNNFLEIIPIFSIYYLPPILISFFFATFFQYRKKVKVSFTDIRDIPFFLDIIIKNMAYKLISKDKNSLKYMHHPKKDFIINDIKSNKYYQRYIGYGDLLEINFDGNTVLMSGSKFHINKIIKNIKKRNKE
jgi:hypothetical protein